MKQIALISFFILVHKMGIAQVISALDIVKKAIAAAGSDWRRPESLYLKGHADFYPKGEASQVIHFGHYEMARIFPSYNDAAHKANGQVAFIALEGDSTYFRLAFDGQKQRFQLAEKAKPYYKNFEFSNNFGFSIIRFADSPDFQLTRLADDQVEGFACYMIYVRDPKGNETTFGIDQQTFQIRQVAFDTAIGYHHRIYSDFAWNPSHTFVNPQRVRIYYEGRKWVDIRWTTFRVNEPIAAELFRP
jgi:hypothetical protein